MLFLLVFENLLHDPTGSSGPRAAAGLQKDARRDVQKRYGKNNEGSMTPLQAISTVLAGTVGSGNIAGVAAAIAIGGPGPSSGCGSPPFSHAPKLAEVSLAVKYREKGPDGDYYGGPMYYIKKASAKAGSGLLRSFPWRFLLLTLCDAALFRSTPPPPRMTTTSSAYRERDRRQHCGGQLIICLGGIKRVGEACSAIVSSDVPALHSWMPLCDLRAYRSCRLCV